MQNFKALHDQWCSGYPSIRTESDYLQGFQVRLFEVKYLSDTIRIRLFLKGQISRKFLGIRKKYSTFWVSESDYLKFQTIRTDPNPTLCYPTISVSDFLISAPPLLMTSGGTTLILKSLFQIFSSGGASAFLLQIFKNLGSLCIQCCRGKSRKKSATRHNFHFLMRTTILLLRHFFSN